jgi:putative ABC transport system permease protein
VILDANLAASNFGSPGIGIDVGDDIALMDFNNTMYNRTVLGFTKQMGINGVFMHEDDALSYFGVSDKKVHLINVAAGEDIKVVSDGLRKHLLPFGFYSVIIHEITEQYLKAQNAFFDLFNAFLSLGLVIGIVGLGVVTLRSVYERRHEIGMMRAIGFKRNMVIGSFLGESGFIAGSGLLIGSLLGIVLGWVLWRDSGFGMEFEKFGIPWAKILIICSIALFFALVSSIPPSFKASRVTPADALRYE